VPHLIGMMLALGAMLLPGPPSGNVEVLRSIGGLPPHIVGLFREPIGFAQLTDGGYLVLDRRAHTVTRIDQGRTTVEGVIDIGFEEGRILTPSALSVAANDRFAVADAPNQYERIQYFTPRGALEAGFYLDTRVAARLAIGPLVLNGVGSMQFTGRSFLLNQPESGALITELNMGGYPVRRLGVLRPTGHESRRDVHLALNVGLPLVDPTGGYYFVFQTGIPMFRKYDESGRLLFERHIEGVELDEAIQAIPTDWATRDTETGTYPLVPPLVRTAAVDRTGRLWVSLMVPYTYVYGRNGDKTRTLQFEAAGVLTPSSLFFTPDDRLLVTPGCYEFDAR